MAESIEFDLTPADRLQVWNELRQRLERYYETTLSRPVRPTSDRDQIRKFARQFDFRNSVSHHEAIDFVIKGLENSVHVAHPGYLGLFNPRPGFASTLADSISAVYNSQLATWEHSPFAVEIESWLVELVGDKFGIANAQGSFTAGGAEGNLSGVLCALNRAFPNYSSGGLLNGVSKRPMFYCSTESHHSFEKAARIVGLGVESLKRVPVNHRLQIDIESLVRLIDEDLRADLRPFLVIGTAGTTGAGSMDDLNRLSELCRSRGLWFHVDAAYGGAVALSSDYRHWLAGIEKADSIAFDFHKWPSLPIGTSIFLTPHQDVLEKTFGISTEYLKGMDGPFAQSTQWSRRFIGLRLLMPLLFHGWGGFERLIKRQIEYADFLRKRLIENHWHIKNDTLLPIVCFNDVKFSEHPRLLVELCEKLIESGKFWVSTYSIEGIETIRVCLANYSTQKRDLEEFVKLVDVLRKKLLSEYS